SRHTSRRPYTLPHRRPPAPTATVTVVINPVNDAPVAHDDTATTDEDTAVNVPVVANDTDVDGDALSVVAVTQGAHGSVANNADGNGREHAGAQVSGGRRITY